jgi:hypothetical protein
MHRAVEQPVRRQVGGCVLEGRRGCLVELDLAWRSLLYKGSTGGKG